MTNPFTYGNPIHDPDRFYGRHEALRQIVNRVRSSARESTSLVGERRIGKTSLLKHLAHPPVASELGLDTTAFCLVYIDFQGLTDITPQRFWERVLSITAREACSPGQREAINALLGMRAYDLFDLEDLFESLSRAGLTIVLLMDEFEYVTQNAHFQTDFFGALRALAIHRNLVLVTSTRRELVDLCHSEEIKGSPFFNIFASVVLRPFTPQDAAEMVDGYARKAGLALSAGERQLILNLGGGHPYFIQMAGYHLVEEKRKGLSKGHSYRAAVAHFDEQAAPHFSYLWSQSTESEKITLLATITLCRQDASDRTEPTVENMNRIHPRAWLDVPSLKRRGLLLENPDRSTYRLLSPRLEKWIGVEIAAAPGQEETPESVASWLKAQNEEPRGPVQGSLPRFKKKYWPIVSKLLKELSFELAGAATYEILIKLLI
jgi:hypothetical protein